MVHHTQVCSLTKLSSVLTINNDSNNNFQLQTLGIAFPIILPTCLINCILLILNL